MFSLQYMNKILQKTTILQCFIEMYENKCFVYNYQFIYIKIKEIRKKFSKCAKSIIVANS